MKSVWQDETVKNINIQWLSEMLQTMKIVDGINVVVEWEWFEEKSKWITSGIMELTFHHHDHRSYIFCSDWIVFLWFKWFVNHSS